MASRVERLAAIVHANPLLAGVAVDVFKLEAESASDWPRVSWIPRRGKVERVQLATCGGLLIGDQTVSGQAIRAQLGFMDAAEVELRCWDKDLESAEALADNVRSAIWQYAKAACTFGDYEFSNQQTNSADDAVSGVAVKFTATVKMIVPTSSQLLTTAKTQAHTGTFQSDIDHAKLEDVC